MKKEYCKPIVVFENFSMSTNIAGTCDRIVNNPTQGTCGIPGSAPDMNLFSANVGKDCQILDEFFDGNDGKYDGFCYHVPEGGPSLFNS